MHKLSPFGRNPLLSALLPFQRAELQGDA